MPRKTKRNKSQHGDNKKKKPLKPGSDPKAVHEVGGKGDFGVPEDDPLTATRSYVSRNTKRSDPGAAQPHSREFDGRRTSGAGGNASGAGSSSGGDLDTDIVGVGTGGRGVATSGKIHEPPGPDDSDGTSSEFASGPPARGENQTHVGEVGGDKRVRGGTTHRQSDPSDVEVTQGPDAATNPEARNDDSFAGEVSSADARGDNMRE